jgi:hypothetical protein
MVVCLVKIFDAGVLAEHHPGVNYFDVNRNAPAEALVL